MIAIITKKQMEELKKIFGLTLKETLDSADTLDKKVSALL